jgi:hypothetical protein
VLQGFRLFGVDGFAQSVEKTAATGRYESVVRAELLDYLATQQPGSFDAVVALDVIEHFDRDGGNQLMKEMERVSAKVVVIATPNGYLHQEATDNPHQEHRSGWIVSDFRARDYAVKGLFGLKGLRGQGHEVRIPSSRVLTRLSWWTSGIPSRIPSLAAGLICRKSTLATDPVKSL